MVCRSKTVIIMNCEKIQWSKENLQPLFVTNSWIHSQRLNWLIFYPRESNQAKNMVKVVLIICSLTGAESQLNMVKVGPNYL